MITTLTINPAVDKTFFIDNFKIDSLNVANKIKYNAGSKGINVSRLLKIVGVDNIATGFIGGFGGDILEEELEGEKVNFDFVKVKANTRVNTKVVDLKNNTFTDINEQGEEISENELFLLFDKLRFLLSKSSMLVMGGSIQSGIPIDIYKQVINMAKEYNIKAVLDCGGEYLARGIEAKPDIIKPNLLELENMINKKCNNTTDVKNAAFEIYKSGVSNVLISMGKDGAVAVCEGIAYRIFPHEVKVLSTVGAGDSFLSGFLYGYINKMPIINSLKFAASFASAKVTKEGTDMPTEGELFKFVDKIVIETI